MIRLPNLDDQTFEDIVEASRRRVMQYCPEWSNFNLSDPGLTLLELFAWLKEMQQYHLNQITREGVLACLRLLGISPRSAAPASTIAVFKEAPPNGLASGFPFATGEGMVFETRESVPAGVPPVYFVWLDTGSGAVPVAESGADLSLSLEPFGAAETEDACLYIGLGGSDISQVRLYFDIDERYDVARTPFGGDMLPARDIAWEYGPGFTAAENVLDMTRGFSVSGEVALTFKGQWEASKPAPDMPKCRWLRARLAKKGAEESPKINKFYENFTTLYQHETLSRAIDTDGSPAVLTDYLGITGEHIVFAKSGEGWKHLKLPDSRISRFDDRTEIKTGSKVPCRIVSVKQGFGAVHSTLTSLPGNRIEIPVKGYFENISLMIEDGGLWYDWQYREDMHTAGPYDRVFTVIDESVVFGDNEHGACPPAGTDNVIISCCRMTLGSEGNVLPHTIAGDEISIGNITFGSGGKNPESIEQALTRVREMLVAADRCVTREDYENMAMSTPGTRILKARAIEGYDPKSGASGIPALVSVVVQPYSYSQLPMPDAGMLERVRRHLEKGRLLSTRLLVAAPVYVPVSVRVTAVSSDSAEAQKCIKEKLQQYLSPIGGALGIGSPVLISDVTAAISSCAGVSRVLGVTLGAPDNAAAIDRSGNVIAPPHAIACPGEIEVQITS